MRKITRQTFLLFSWLFDSSSYFMTKRSFVLVSKSYGTKSSWVAGKCLCKFTRRLSDFAKRFSSQQTLWNIVKNWPEQENLFGKNLIESISRGGGCRTIRLCISLNCGNKVLLVTFPVHHSTWTPHAFFPLIPFSLFCCGHCRLA